ncbi:hypothetical protein QR77_41365 [Streptomyces sp. 150FB]|nr:hypothetical protein QR77_41365 [Streptomyces sp. 150FB]
MPAARPVLLNWRDGTHFRKDAPCVLCGHSTPLRSHAGEAVHKVCAETWNADHPERVLEGRFVSDPEPRSRTKGTGDHA